MTHVVTPDPADLFVFTEGIEQILALEPLIKFRVDKVICRDQNPYVEGVETVNADWIRGMLLLNMPLVIVRDGVTGNPAVTLTLRGVDHRVAFIQVSVDADGVQVPR